ncbi:hypothetical protein ACHAPQ_006368 [Fusarium lateritium]
MNLELLERFRGSYPSRQSFMGFINHCEPEPATSKPTTPEPEFSRHATSDTEVFDTPTCEALNASIYETGNTPTHKVKNTLTCEVENTLTCEILDTTISEASNDTSYEVLDTPNYEAESSATYEVENTPTCDILETTTSEIPNATIPEVENAPTYETLDTPHYEAENTPAYETVNNEPSLETREQITDEFHTNQQEDSVLPITNYPTYLTYPKYYETSIYDSISTERLPPIIEDMVYEPHHAYHKTTKQHLSIEALDSALETSEIATSEPEITECTTPDSLDFELESKVHNPSNLILSEPKAARPIINEPMAQEATLKTNEPMNTGLKKPTISFDPNGDLVLTIGSGPGRDMLVDSRALSRASPKLHAILSQSGKKNENDWTLELPEDDPLPFTILLNLIHTRFERIPARVTLKQLYGICILTQKYNMTEVLRPVAERWFRDIERPSEGEYGLFFKKAFVAWELGFAEDLSEMAGHVVLNCYLDEDEQLVIGKKKEKLSDFSDFQRIPLLKCIEEHRELAMETCWEECQRLSDQILKGSIKGSMCHASHAREDVCLMLGKMLSKAGEENILDLFMTGSIYQYCHSLRLDLATLDHKILLVADYIDMCGWCDGVFDTMNEIRCQLHRAVDPLYMSHIQAMEVQASKIRMRPWITDYDQEE